MDRDVDVYLDAYQHETRRTSNRLSERDGLLLGALGLAGEAGRLALRHGGLPQLTAARAAEEA